MTDDDKIKTFSSNSPASSGGMSPRRRDVLAAATIGLGCAGGCALAYPFLNSLNGTQGARAGEDDTIDVDVSALKPGEQMTVVWRGWPVFLQRRTPEMLMSLRDVKATASLRDPESRILQQPSDAVNWHRSVVPEIGVFIGICTHLGCVPSYTSGADQSGGYSCPCHGSHFDLAGRVMKGAPAPYNLPVPPVTIVSPAKVLVGKSKGDPDFDMSSIQQI